MSEPVYYDFFIDYDVASVTDYIYGVFQTQFRTLPKPAKTSGSSTTWVDVTSGDNFAAPLAVGDLLYIPSAGTVVAVTAKASDASITVSTAADLGTGTQLHYRKFLSGTSVSDGWVDTSDLDSKTIQAQIDTFTATSIGFTIEGRNPGGAPTTIYTFPDQTAVTVGTTTPNVSALTAVKVTENFQEMRFGAKVTGDGGAQSISASLYGIRQ